MENMQANNVDSRVRPLKSSRRRAHAKRKRRIGFSVLLALYCGSGLKTSCSMECRLTADFGLCRELGLTHCAGRDSNPRPSD